MSIPDAHLLFAVRRADARIRRALHLWADDERERGRPLAGEIGASNFLSAVSRRV